MAGVVEYLLRARDMLSPVFTQVSRNATAANRQIAQVNRTQQQSTGTIERMSNAMRYLQERRSRAFDERHIGRYNVAIQNMQRELNRLNNLPPQSFLQRMQDANGSAGSLLGQFKGIIATIGAFQGVKSILTLAMNLEQTNIGFEVLLGNSEKAKVMLDGLNKFANETPFQSEGLIENAKMMLAFGTSAEKILPRLKMLGDIAMGDQNKLNSLSLVMSQVTSLGKMQGNDKIQFINAGFNPLAEMVKMTGKSMAYFEDQLSKGNISIQMVEDALKHATSEGGQFFGMMEKMSKTTSGKFATLTGSLKQTGAEIGLKLLPYANQLIEMLMPMVDWLSQNADMVLQLTGVIVGAVVVFKIVIGVIKLWTIAQALLNGTMMLNPIGLVIAGIAALVAAVVYCYNKFDWFRGIIHGVWESFKALVQFIKEGVMVYVNSLVDMFSGLGNIIKSVFSADWDGIKEGAKQVVEGYKGAFTGMIDVAKNNAPKIAGAFKDGYNKGLNSGGIDADSFFGSLGSSTSGGGGLLGGGGGGTTPTETMKNIAGGGARPTNINVVLNREMVGSITIQPLTMAEGADEMKDVIMQVLAQILNSANKVPTT